MVADALVYHPALAHWLKFTATTAGRDKLMRTLQYFSRFYSWYLYRLNATPAEIAPYESIKKQFGNIRKAIRLGKFIEHFKAAAQAFDAKAMDPFLRYCAIGRQLGYAGYLSFDNYGFLDTLGVVKVADKKALQKRAYTCWLSGLAFNTIAGLYQLYQLSQRAAAINKKDGESALESKKIEKDRQSVRLQLLSDLCDMGSPSMALGYANFLDDGIVGLAGTTSSLIGVYSVWKKTA